MHGYRGIRLGPRVAQWFGIGRYPLPFYGAGTLLPQRQDAYSKTQRSWHLTATTIRCVRQDATELAPYCHDKMRIARRKICKADVGKADVRRTDCVESAWNLPEIFFFFFFSLEDMAATDNGPILGGRGGDVTG
jgi:hypothetical protein